MGQVQRVQDGLTDIGIRMTGQAPEPGIDGVQGLADCGEAAAIHDALGHADMFVHHAPVGIGDSDRCGHIAIGDKVGAEFL